MCEAIARAGRRSAAVIVVVPEDQSIERLAAAVYPPMTNSCPRLTRIFCEAPERRPDSYRLSRRLATSPSNPCALMDAIRSGSGVEVTEIPSGLRQLGQHLGFQQRPAGFECLGAYIPSASISTSNTKKASGASDEPWFCSALKDGFPSLPNATSSPSRIAEHV